MRKLTDARDRNHERNHERPPPSKGGLICPICGGRSFDVVRTQNNVTKQNRRVRMCKSRGQANSSPFSSAVPEYHRCRLLHCQSSARFTRLACTGLRSTDRQTVGNGHHRP